MITCSLPDFDSDDLVSYQDPYKFWIKFWILLTVYVIAALYLLCSLISELTSLHSHHGSPFGNQETLSYSVALWEINEQRVFVKIALYRYDNYRLINTKFSYLQ